MKRFDAFLKKSCVIALLLTVLFGKDTLAAPAKQGTRYVTACAFSSTGRGPAVCIDGETVINSWRKPIGLPMG